MTAGCGVRVEPGRARETSFRAYAVRFVLGGAITAAAGLVAHAFGPVVGGLFLAFPAIAPAAITLIERHDGTRAAGASALGAAIGGVGLLAFGAVVWLLAERLPAWLVLLLATLVWLAASVGFWAAFNRLRYALKRAPRSAPGRPQSRPRA
jgi:uncharacterized membrane protein (GlpM family)